MKTVTLKDLTKKQQAKLQGGEHNVQVACLKWFTFYYSKFSDCLFAIPNGAKRTAWEAKQKKDEGMKAGVADLFLMVATPEYHGLFVEIKTMVGVQSEAQKQFQAICEKQNYKYEVCNSVDAFRACITNYLK